MVPFDLELNDFSKLLSFGSSEILLDSVCCISVVLRLVTPGGLFDGICWGILLLEFTLVPLTGFHGDWLFSDEGLISGSVTCGLVTGAGLAADDGMEFGVKSESRPYKFGSIVGVVNPLLGKLTLLNCELCTCDAEESLSSAEFKRGRFLLTCLVAVTLLLPLICSVAAI